MAWRYRDRRTKAFVSSATYNRSKARGGTRFERFSDAKWHKGTRSPGSASQPREDKPESKASASIPSSRAEYERMFEKKLKRMSKRTRAEFYQAEYDGPEYETGVDY